MIRAASLSPSSHASPDSAGASPSSAVVQASPAAESRIGTRRSRPPRRVRTASGASSASGSRARSPPCQVWTANEPSAARIPIRHSVSGLSASAGIRRARADGAAGSAEAGSTRVSCAWSISSGSWEATSTAQPWAAASVSRSRTSRRRRASRPTVGSSSASRDGRWARAATIATRRCSPPDRREGWAPARWASPERSSSWAANCSSPAHGEASTSSRTVRATKECSGFWGTLAMRSRSGRSTLPVAGAVAPSITRSAVVLPAPLGPVSTVIRPEGTSRSIVSRRPRAGTVTPRRAATTGPS